MLRQAVRLNSLTEVALTKLDVLDTLRDGEGLRRLRGRGAPATTHTPVPPERSCTRSGPCTRSCPGWRTDLTGATTSSDLPAAARGYVDFLSEQIGVPVRLIGVGPGREQFVSLATA